MPQSLSKVYIHIVFSTKDRTPYLKDAEAKNKLHAYIGGICNEHDSKPLSIGGVEDHIHILCTLPKTLSQSDLVKEIKRASSKWIKQELDGQNDFGWQRGYAIFSISETHVEATSNYILDQEAHHKNVSFKEEYLKLLNKYKISFDEKYMWD